MFFACCWTRVGFQVLEAAGGQEAVDLFISGRPHLIWMDLRMPGMDGNEAAGRIREAEKGGREEGKEIHTPIIALTAGVMGNEEPASRSPLFDDWVNKPFRQDGGIRASWRNTWGCNLFTRRPKDFAAEADKGREKKVITSADLAVLPAEWLKEFFQTLKKGRSAEMIDLIDRISPDHADLAGSLAELVRFHHFDRLIPLIREALKENADG